MRDRDYEPLEISREREETGYQRYEGDDIDEDLSEEEYEAELKRREPRVGSRSVLYLNAYSVSRNFGGREEGGWWYNSGEPLASVPVDAVWKRNVNGQMALFPLSWNNFRREIRKLERMFTDTQHGDIYSVLGGEALEIQVETHEARWWSTTRPHYE